MTVTSVKWKKGTNGLPKAHTFAEKQLQIYCRNAIKTRSYLLGWLKRKSTKSWIPNFGRHVR